MQLLEDFGISQAKTARTLQAYEAERKQVAQGYEMETIVLHDSDSNEHTLEGPAQASKDEQPQQTPSPNPLP